MASLRLIRDGLPDNELATYADTEVVTIGRSGQCQVCLPKDQRSISRIHARIAFEDGAWHLWDTSSTGTLVDDVPIPGGVPVRLADGARLGIGPFSFTIHIDEDSETIVHDPRDREEFDVSVSEIDLAELDAGRVLRSALELPARLGEARGESDVFAVACRYLVTTLSPVLACAYVVLAPGDEDESFPKIVARYPTRQDASGTSEMPAPAISRRVVERITAEPEAMVFLSRKHREQTMGATVALSVNSLGACFVEEGIDGRPVLLYALGEQALTTGSSLVARYLKLVATLTRQHLLTLRRVRMSKYFSPRVVEMLMQGGGAVATQANPSVVPTTTLFFDLRGFSLSVEASASDLLDLHDDLSFIITLVTKIVFDAGGTVIDYQGDAVLAAWGVPFPQSNQAERAARCALDIISRLDDVGIGLFGNRGIGDTAICGIGLCKGDVLAGTVGSREMFKYGVLGPTVNIAKRLESLTKPSRLNAPILCCESLAAELNAAGLRTRRVARMQPGGMTRIENIYELINQSTTNERGWLSEHDERWNSALGSLEAIRSVSDLTAMEPLLDELPPNHPRTHWIRRSWLRLQSPGAIEQWDGIIRQ